MRKFKELRLVWKILVLLLLVVLIGVWGVVGVVLGKKSVQALEIKTPVGTLINENIPELADYPNPINGTLYNKREAKAWKDRVPLAVMVENSFIARNWQFGLSKADIVYEALAEGAVTRFVAIFLSQDAPQIGPVRSARKYYYDWIIEYKPAYAHWGGNIGVRQLASQLFGARDFDEFGSASVAYHKDQVCKNKIPEEHCGRTSTDKLWSVASARNVNKLSEITSWQFKDDAPSKKSSASEITIGFDNHKDFIVSWHYDPAANSYLRFNAGVEHKDQVTGQQIRVKTVVVCSLLFLGNEIVTGVSNRSFQTIGENKVQIFQDGTVTAGVWKKSSREARTKFIDNNGKEIALNRGQIWMEMIPEGSAVTYK